MLNQVPSSPAAEQRSRFLKCRSFGPVQATITIKMFEKHSLLFWLPVSNSKPHKRVTTLLLRCEKCGHVHMLDLFITRVQPYLRRIPKLFYTNWVWTLKAKSCNNVSYWKDYKEMIFDLQNLNFGRSHQGTCFIHKFLCLHSQRSKWNLP